MNKVLINAGNLHSGGGVQVATSFLLELSKLFVADMTIDIIVSNRVNVELMSNSVSIENFNSYKVKDYTGIQAIFCGIDKEFSNYKVVFTIFGPAYTFCNTRRKITGFAQSWIIYPDNESKYKLSNKNRILIKIKFKIQKILFFRDEILIVEQQSVKNKLVELGFNSNKIHIAHNAVADVYHDKRKWTAIDKSWRKKGHIAIGIISRDHSHKNIGILEDVFHVLEERYKLKIQFIVTFTESEWSKRDNSFKNVITNIGELTTTQCPTFYESLDGVVFPSLLESFSITPFEAMIMKKPIFASDRDFVKNICSEHANYFEPLDANNIASVIFDYFSCTENCDEARLEAARNHVLKFSNPSKRANKYIDVIRSQLGQIEI